MEQQQRGFCSFTSGRTASCGTGVSTGQTTMRLSITSTTGSPVELTVPRGETVEGLRTRISQKLRLQRDRIVLLHKDRKLTAGKLMDLGVADGSKLTLVPVIEAGLVCSTTRAERTMMDVLESLTEVQISDFLSGRSPLTVNLGVGAHMMYVQLQLSAQDVVELQQDQDSRACSSSKMQTGLPAETSVCSSTYTTDSTTTSLTSQTSSSAPEISDSTFPVQLRTQRPTTIPAVNCHHHSSSHHSSPPCPTQTSTTTLSTSSLPCCSPHPTCPRQATTPVCPSGSNAGPPSPVPASTFKESNVNSSSAADVCKQPGAVIESFVSHSPGVFSGTFSGTLAPCSQSGISHPRRGIAIILRILNDLLRAAYHHQGASPTQPHLHCPASNPPVSQTSKTTTKTVVTQRPDLMKGPAEESHPTTSFTEENQTLHCKLEHLQFLMHQRRLRRRTRRTSHLSQTSHPYQHCHHRP